MVTVDRMMLCDPQRGRLLAVADVNLYDKVKISSVRLTKDEAGEGVMLRMPEVQLKSGKRHSAATILDKELFLEMKREVVREYERQGGTAHRTGDTDGG